MERHEPEHTPLSQQRRKQEERTRLEQTCNHRWYMVRSRGVRKCETCGEVDDVDLWIYD